MLTCESISCKIKNNDAQLVRIEDVAKATALGAANRPGPS